MYILNLKLNQYRNYDSAEISLDPNTNVILGPNGQGKTNLLEAIFLAVHGESFRCREKEELVNKISTYPYAEVQMQVSHKGSIHKITTRIEDGKIKSELNGKKNSRSDIRKIMSVVLFSPESLNFIKQGPSERRTFLDDLIQSLEKAEIDTLADYQKCLRTRNKVLKGFNLGELQRSEALDVLVSLEGTFLKLSTHLTMARMRVLQDISARAKIEFQRLNKDQNVDISVDYEISQKSAIAWSHNQVYDSIKTRLTELREAELSTGYSLVGPHRHDFKIYFNGHNLLNFGSQGQQRAAILAFKLAQVGIHHDRHEVFPVVLFDDVFSELDQERRKNLLQVLSGMDAQFIVTTTELDSMVQWGEKSQRIYNVEKGKVNTGWK